MPPHAFIAQRRMIEARRLLCETGADMTEIGLALGYSGGGAFARAFRQHAGMSPSAFRRLRKAIREGWRTRQDSNL